MNTNHEVVDQFAAAMKHKMDIGSQKGRAGWETCSADYLRNLMYEHLEKGDPVDVANFCMMLWAHGASTND